MMFHGGLFIKYGDNLKLQAYKSDISDHECSAKSRGIGGQKNNCGHEHLVVSFCN